jgi:intraflagellar transport protein 74
VYRMPTGAGIVPGTARPGSRAGAAALGALSAQIKVADRPVTQQGLGGLRTGAKGPMRQVYDKSYYMGLLRGKTQELSQEISRISQEIDSHQKENAAYLSYEQRAESLASEITDLRGELSDYNTLMDKVNTDTEQASVMAETAALKIQNDMESRNIDALFAERQQLEASARQIETDIAGAKQATELVISTMDPTTLHQYQRLRAENEAIEIELAEKQGELDKLVAKSEALSREVAGSELRQESWRLRQQLGEVTARRDDWRLKDQETPEQERERLLKQVKADNQEIASMQKSAGEVEEKVALLQEKLHRMEGELEEGMEERSQKYTELRSKEQMITEFLNDFDQNKAAEEEKIQQLEANIVTILSHISQGMTQSQQLPEPDQFQELQADLAFKQEEKEKSEATAKSLDSENQKLQQDLVKVEELDGNVTQELQSVREEIDKMTQEIDEFTDIPALQLREEETRQQLELEKERLARLREEARESQTVCLCVCGGGHIFLTLPTSVWVCNSRCISDTILQSTIKVVPTMFSSLWMPWVSP